MQKRKFYNLTQKGIKRIICIMLAFTILTTLSVFTNPLKVKAANLLMIRVSPNNSMLDTYSGNYRYNTTFSWDYDSRAVNGYYVAVKRLSDGVWVIKNTASTSASKCYDHIYGLKPGEYAFYVSSIDANYKLIDSHYAIAGYIDYDGGGSCATIF